MVTLSTWILSIIIEGGPTMEMKNPVHPGQLVKACLDDLGFSVAEAAKGIGITRQQLHNVVAGRSSITPEMAIRFEKAFGGTAETWLKMQVNYDLAQMRQRASGIVVKRLTPKVA
jgi:addiction module HigA family antidote